MSNLQKTICGQLGYGELTISSDYCPPRYGFTKEQFEEYFGKLGNRFLDCGDYNAEHMY